MSKIVIRIKTAVLELNWKSLYSGELSCVFVQTDSLTFVYSDTYTFLSVLE